MEIPVVLLPGLGANTSLFLEQKKFFGDQLVTPVWIAPYKNENLAQYCNRFAESLLKRELADYGEVFLGGFSFGGMASLELAHIFKTQDKLKVKGVFLISSGRTKKILRSPFKIQATLGSLVPDMLLKLVLEKQMLKRFLQDESLSAEQSSCLKEMVESLDVEFFKWSLKACAHWDPKEKFLNPQKGFSIFEIQGEKDAIIPLSCEEGVVTLKNAKHLIQYTHAKEINQWLDQIIQNG